MKRTKDATEVIREMTARGDFARLGVEPPDPTAVEELVRGVLEDEQVNIASLTKPWDEMSNQEQDAWFDAHGVRELTPEEVTEYYGGYGHATIIPLGASLRVIKPGNIVMVQEASGGWRNQMRAVSCADDLVYIAEEAEYRCAAYEGRAPLTIAYPAERVKLAEG